MSNTIHANFTAAPERTGTLEFSRESFVAHMTHTGAESFLRKHLEYAIFEAESGETFDQITTRCVTAIETQFRGVGPGHELWAQRCGWSVYFWSIMMLAAERGKDHAATYQTIAKQLLEENWK